jgi:tight adherence protein C
MNLCGAVMNDLAIAILTFLSVIAIGSAVVLISAARRRILQDRLHGQPATRHQPSSRPNRFGLVDAIDQIGRAVGEQQPSSNLRTQLMQAGHYDESATSIFYGAQVLLVLLALPIGGLLAFSFNLSMPVRIGLVFLIVAVMGLLPNIIIMFEQRRRTAEVRRNLPDAIDLLEICVSSGMGLDMAWNAVSDEIRGVSTTLADEMALANLEMHLGAQRAEALRHMAHRTGVEDVSSLVATLVQSERFGTSVSQALRTYADAMRSERSSRAEESAEKLAVKLLFPMVLFIFPCMFIVILGPAIIKIAKVFMTA